MNQLIICTILVLLLILCFKLFSYYCATQGLLYYIETKYKDMPDEETMKELIKIAMLHTFKKLFHKN